MEKCYQVAIGIPTMNSSMYIYNYLQTIADMMSNPETVSLQYQFYICLNGIDEGKKTEQEIQRFICDRPDVSCHLLLSKALGKNNALNIILDEASKDCEIIHFLDDDVKLSNNAIVTNLLELIKKREEYEVPILVGSNFFAVKHSFLYFLKRSHNPLTGIKEYLLNGIFSLPFEEESESPNFCLGGSLCFFINDFTKYPLDKSGIADDGYVGNYFAIKGKQFYFENKKLNIIKPFESKMYFEVATSYKDWLKQQIRIYAGVYYSYLYFEEELEYFREIFSWKYSVGTDFRGMYGPEKTLSRKLKLFILRRFQKVVFKESMKLIEKSQMPEWAEVKNTKRITM